MNKLIKRLPTILIGLSLFLLQFSCTLFNSDEALVKYTDRYINNSNQEIELVFKSSVEGESNLIIPPSGFIDRVKITWNDDNTIQRFIDELYGTDSDALIIELIVENELIKSWNGPPISMGDNNNPFNYNSWAINENEKSVQFTINNSDIGWIPGGVIHDLMDTNTDLIRTGFRDNASGYTIRNIYDALDRGIESPQSFRDRLLSENGSRDETDVRELFEAYYWN